MQRRTCCCSQPVSRMLATVLGWLTDFLTGAILSRSLRWHFSHSNNIILIIRTLSTLKSGQYPVPMTRKPRKGDLRGKNPKKFNGEPAPDPSRSLHLRRSFRKSVSICPRSAPGMRTHIFAKQCEVITNSKKAGTLWKTSGFLMESMWLEAFFDSKTLFVYEITELRSFPCLVHLAS